MSLSTCRLLTEPQLFTTWTFQQLPLCQFFHCFPFTHRNPRSCWKQQRHCRGPSFLFDASVLRGLGRTWHGLCLNGFGFGGLGSKQGKRKNRKKLVSKKLHDSKHPASKSIALSPLPSPQGLAFGRRCPYWSCGYEAPRWRLQSGFRVARTRTPMMLAGIKPSLQSYWDLIYGCSASPTFAAPQQVLPFCFILHTPRHVHHPVLAPNSRSLNDGANLGKLGIYIISTAVAVLSQFLLTDGLEPPASEQQKNETEYNYNFSILFPQWRVSFLTVFQSLRSFIICLDYSFGNTKSAPFTCKQHNLIESYPTFPHCPTTLPQDPPQKKALCHWLHHDIPVPKPDRTLKLQGG